MTTKGGSLDDLPLAAYTTGMRPDESDELVRESHPAVDVDRTMPMVAATELGLGPDDVEESLDDESAPPVLVRVRAFATQNPRIAAGGALVVVIVAGILLLGSGGVAPAASGATPTQSAPPTIAVVPDPAAATLTLSGALDALLILGGSAGASTAGATAVSATWTDSLLNTLSLTGPVDRGTRTTDTRLVLTLTVVIDGAPVTFTSRAGECTIGMAVQSKSVTGSFTCHKLRSEVGKLTLDASGTYRT